MKHKHLIAPSILSADFANLGDEVKMINESEADWFHIDVMDGVFVPNITFGFPLISCIKRFAKKPLDVHLMIVDPDRYLQAFKDAGANILTVHYEACTHVHRTISKIHELGMKAGVAINPHTPIGHLENLLDDLDIVLIMSVNPGFGGQKFIENTYRKVNALRTLSEKQNTDVLIQVDGGIDKHNYQALLKSGANVLVAGHAIFSSDQPQEEIRELKKVMTML